MLSNISPQVGAGFNRHYWARFEAFVRELTLVADDVWVVTGPLWLPGRAAPGEAHWALPGGSSSSSPRPTAAAAATAGDGSSGRSGPLPAAAKWAMKVCATRVRQPRLCGCCA